MTRRQLASFAGTVVGAVLTALVAQYGLDVAPRKASEGAALHALTELAVAYAEQREYLRTCQASRCLCR
jgi:hypothetical protein